MQKILFYKVMGEITFVFVLRDTYYARFDFHSQTIDVRHKIKGNDPACGIAAGYITSVGLFVFRLYIKVSLAVYGSAKRGRAFSLCYKAKVLTEVYSACTNARGAF